ncbi:MAG: Hint domain-containing protein [Acetobacter malorum]|uniref:Hint domain-containing protein n=1 Tax=Acetobacter malorum TaxID=178901 RepID=UPI0039E8AFC3
MENITVENGVSQDCSITFPDQPDEEAMYTVIFQNGGGTLNVTNVDMASGQGQVLIAVVNDSGGLGNIVIPENLYQTVQGVYSPEDGNTYLSFQNSNQYQQTFVFQYAGNIFNLGDDEVVDMTNALSSQGSDAYLPVCFLADSMIETVAGPCPVQDLTVGQEILTYQQGQPISRRLVWIGKKQSVIRPDLTDDAAGYPVRLLKDALAEGVPYKDMLITAEHCLFLNGKFIPARMLVNDRSVFYDRSVTDYTYYHLETETHSVIMADGVLTESYLDTGNRRSFRQDGKVFILGGKPKSWALHAAAPLGTERDFVEPVFRQIEERAKGKNFVLHTEKPDLTSQSDLHLVTAAGDILRPTRRHEGEVIFMLPDGVEAVRIVSNRSRPCDVFGPFVDDRRMLGVAVGEIRLVEQGQTIKLTNHLTDASLSGWHAPEGGGSRWTTGDAFLSLGQRQSDGLAQLILTLAQEGPYRLSGNRMAQQKQA